MKQALKARAITLRKKGWSYNDIKNRLNVSKSTLSHWLRDIPYNPNETVLKRIAQGTANSNATRYENKAKSIADGRKFGKDAVAKLTERDLFMLGLGLYIGEGSKLYENIEIINANPEVIKLSVKWFTDIFKVPPQNFKLSIHLYPDTSQQEALKFWSKVSGIPIKQFGKTQVDSRENKSKMKKRKLPHGTANLKILACKNDNFGVKLHRRIIGCIEAIYDHVRV